MVMDREKEVRVQLADTASATKTFELMEVFRKRNLLKTRVKSCLQLPGIRRCPSVFVIISVYFSQGCRLILL